MERDTRRVVVQGDGPYWIGDSHPGKVGSHVPGTVERWEHIEAWEGYRRTFPRSAAQQDADRIEERGGFGFVEMTKYLGHEPTTWQPAKGPRR